jgi:hypothetical protein
MTVVCGSSCAVLLSPICCSRRAGAHHGRVHHPRPPAHRRERKAPLHQEGPALPTGRVASPESTSAASAVNQRPCDKLRQWPPAPAIPAGAVCYSRGRLLQQWPPAAAGSAHQDPRGHTATRDGMLCRQAREEKLRERILRTLSGGGNVLLPVGPGPARPCSVTLWLFLPTLPSASPGPLPPDHFLQPLLCCTLTTPTPPSPSMIPR